MSFIPYFPSVAATPSDGDIIVAGLPVAEEEEGLLGFGVIGVDPTNGNQEVITFGGFFGNPTRVAVNDNNGDIIVADANLSTELIRVNPANGDQELIGDFTNFSVDDMDTDSNGDVIVATMLEELLGCAVGGAIVKVDALTGNPELISCGGLLGDLTAVAVDDSSGDIIVVNKLPGAFGLNDYELIRVNPANGDQELITTIESFDVKDMDTDPNGDIIVITSPMETPACNGTAVVKIDGQTGNEELISCGGILEDLTAVAVDDTNGNITVVSDDFPFSDPPFGTHLIGVNPANGDQELIALNFINIFGDLDIFPGLVIPPEKADLSVSKTAPESVVVGEFFEYRITVVNNGPFPAPLVTLVDVLPEDFFTNIGNLQIDPPSAASCIFPARVVPCDLGTMQSGDSVTISIFGAVLPSAQPGDTLINTVEVSSTAPDDFPNNNEAMTETEVNFATFTEFEIKFNCEPEVEEFLLTDPEFTRDGQILTTVLINQGPFTCLEDLEGQIFLDGVPNDFHAADVLIRTPDGVFTGNCDIDVPEPPNFEISFDVVDDEVVCTPGSSTLVVLSVIPAQIPPPIVGGEIIPIETTSLLLASAQSFSWMIPVILSGIGIGLFVVSRKSENS